MSENTDFEAELANLGGDETDQGMDMSDLNLPTLSLSDEDLDTSAANVEYKTIPQWTKLEAMIYDVEVSRSKAGNLMWKVTFQTVVDTWGPKKRMTAWIVFHPNTAFNWGPFLKAVGLVTSSGQVGPDVFARVNEIKGKVICAQILGHNWKDQNGNRKQSSGKKADRSKYPTPAEITEHGIRLFEDIGNFSAYDPEASDAREDAEESLDGLAHFSGGDDYL